MLNTLINGKQADAVNSNDRGLHYGDGLFETMLFLNGEIRNKELHWQRLQKGCRQLVITAPDINLLESEIAQLIKGYEERSLVIKLLITRGESERGYKYSGSEIPTRILSCYEAVEYPETYYSRGIALHYCTMRLGQNPKLAGLKHLNRLEQVIARNERDDKVYQEGIMMDVSGKVVEGTMSNLFIVASGQIITPALESCGIEGVMRQNVIKMAESDNFSVSIREVSKNDVINAEEVFITNSLMGVCPVRRVEDQQYNVPGAITSRLMQLLAA